MPAETLDAMTANLSTEDVPSLADFAEAPGGALAPGWYSATIIEGYTTRKAGKVFTTSDNPSAKGDSRNLRLCFAIEVPGADAIQMQESFNYRPSDFSTERLAFIKEARAEYKGVKGRWSDTDAQRSSLAVAKLGAIEKALGFALRTTDGMAPAKAIDQKVDVRLIVNEDGFNEVAKFDKAGSKVKASK